MALVLFSASILLFPPWVLGLFSATVHWVTLYFKTRPPGSFFFIMIASMSSCMPYNLHLIPERIGLMGMGTMLACLLALIYCFMTTQPQPEKNMNSVSTEIRKKKYVNIIEALIIGLFMFGSLLIGPTIKTSESLLGTGLLRGSNAGSIFVSYLAKGFSSHFGNFYWICIVLGITFDKQRPFGYMCQYYGVAVYYRNADSQALRAGSDFYHSTYHIAYRGSQSTDTGSKHVSLYTILGYFAGKYIRFNGWLDTLS